jgi:RNA polymerase sigma-70 factor (ECF subfamily)
MNDVPGSPMGEGEFSALMHAAATPAYRLAVTMLRDPGRAEDAVQDAAVKAWRHRARLAGHDSFRPWFLAIVANECRSLRRRAFWGRETEELHAETPGARDTGSDLALDLDRALRTLSKEDRASLYLYHYLDLPVEEAAEVMSCSTSAFRSRLARAARRVRPALEGYEPAD